MRLRPVLVALMVAAASVLAIQGTASAAPVTKQNFTLTSETEEGGTVVASGAINATGEDVVISDTEDQFVFPDGTLTIVHAPVRGKGHFHEQQCSGTFRETGTYVISEGTGLYEGVTGSGTYRVDAHVDGCTEPPTGTLTITARGSLNPPGSDV